MAYEGPYGSFAGVAGLTRHIRYGQANHPTVEDVEGWLTARAGQITGWLAAAGYVTPVTLAAAKPVLDRFANYGAASDAEAAQRTGGYTEDDEDRREVWFAREFNRAEAWINSGALGEMGVPLNPSPAVPSRAGAIGVIKAGTCADPRLQGRRGLR
jgi:hypothetical protein